MGKKEGADALKSIDITIVACNARVIPKGPLSTAMKTGLKTHRAANSSRRAMLHLQKSPLLDRSFAVTCLVLEAGGKSDYPQDDTGDIGQDDRPILRWLLEQPVGRPKHTVECCAQG